MTGDYLKGEAKEALLNWDSPLRKPDEKHTEEDHREHNVIFLTGTEIPQEKLENRKDPLFLHLLVKRSDRC